MYLTLALTPTLNPKRYPSPNPKTQSATSVLPLTKVLTLITPTTAPTPTLTSTLTLVPAVVLTLTLIPTLTLARSPTLVLPPTVTPALTQTLGRWNWMLAQDIVLLCDSRKIRKLFLVVLLLGVIKDTFKNTDIFSFHLLFLHFQSWKLTSTLSYRFWCKDASFPPLRCYPPPEHGRKHIFINA